ncbi:MAG: creatininase family protein, partial [Terriglobia bacterium]
VDYSGEPKAPVDLARLRSLGPAEAKEVLGDGNFAGLYQRSDEDMLEIWRTGVEETRRVIAKDWS